MKHLAACLLGLCFVCGAPHDVTGPASVGGRISPADAADTEPIDLEHSPPAEVRKWFYNHGNLGDPEGDCVWVSIGMNAVRRNNIKATTLAWDTRFGQVLRGAAGPSQVAAACQHRGIAIYNVTGQRIDETYAWAEYAAKTGRGAAIGFGRRHFQTLMGRDLDTGEWLVCDNNSPGRVDRYSDSAFRQLHAASGFWIVVLDGPAPPPPITGVVRIRKRPSWLSTILGYLT